MQKRAEIHAAHYGFTAQMHCARTRAPCSARTLTPLPYLHIIGIERKGVTVSANREGLLSFARQLRRLADGLTGDHIHYDEYNSLEEGSAALIIEKTE